MCDSVYQYMYNFSGAGLSLEEAEQVLKVLHHGVEATTGKLEEFNIKSALDLFLEEQVKIMSLLCDALFFLHLIGFPSNF